MNCNKYMDPVVVMKRSKQSGIIFGNFFEGAFAMTKDGLVHGSTA